MKGPKLTALDDVLLRRSFEVAQAARQNGNHPFGALLANQQGAILLEAENTVSTEQDLTGHAELNLVRAASGRLSVEVMRGLTMYASTEPCPMCAGAVHWSGVSRLVYGLSAVRLYDLSVGTLAEAPIDVPCREILSRSSHEILVLGPALEREAEKVHSGFWPAP